MSETVKLLSWNKNYSRRDFFKNAAGASLAAPLFLQCRRNASGNSKKRNIVLILIDDMRFDAMSCLGHPVLETPNFDRLAQNGILFRNAFVSTSLCSPSRATILTGLYAHKHRILDNQTPLPESIPTFPVQLQKAGYKTGFIGKWHMGGSKDSPRPGFDRWVSFRGQGVYFNPLFNIDGTHVQREGYTTDLITEYAADFVKENKDRPFFLYMSHKAVHDDFVPAPRHKNKYRDIVVPEPASMADTEENYKGKPAWLKAARKSCIGVDAMYDNRYGFDRFYRDYCECLLGVDDSVGALLDTLENEGLIEDTLVIFMSDNGFLCGEHGLIDKRNMYEPSIRVPLIVHCPALADRGRLREELVLNMDLAPTILEAAGASPLPSIHGRSFLPLVKGEPAGWRTEFLYEYFWERDYPQNPSVLGLRTDKYSYMRYHGIWDINELYDIENDPHQMNNLLGDVRITTQVGYEIESSSVMDRRSRNMYNGQIKDPELRSLVFDLERRLFEILDQTGGRVEPSWYG